MPRHLDYLDRPLQFELWPPAAQLRPALRAESAKLSGAEANSTTTKAVPLALRAQGGGHRSKFSLSVFLSPKGAPTQEPADPRDLFQRFDPVLADLESG